MRTDGSQITKTFYIHNTGTATLNLSGSVSISGTNAAEFTLTSAPASVITVGNSTSFQITFDPSDIGIRSAQIQITSDDADLSPFTFDIQGIGTEPVFALKGNNIAITNNDNSPSNTDFTDFDDVRIDGSQITRTFYILNTGTATLNLSGSVNISGTNAADFTLTSAPTSVIAVGDSTAFQITFDPADIGIRSAQILITSDDTDLSPFTFDIQGNGTEPIFTLKGNNNVITNNDNSPSSTDFTDFGDVRTDASQLTRTFYILNEGTATLNLSGSVNISGTNATDFTLSSAPENVLTG